jgi:hypothetical protein
MRQLNDSTQPLSVNLPDHLDFDLRGRAWLNMVGMFVLDYFYPRRYAVGGRFLDVAVKANSSI